MLNVALILSFVILLLNKWDILLKYEARRLSWMPKGDCFFCLSFWASLIIGIVQREYLYPFTVPVIVVLITSLIYGNNNLR